MVGGAGAATFIVSPYKFGVEGFEPPAYCSQSSRANQAALYSVVQGIVAMALVFYKQIYSVEVTVTVTLSW